MVDRENREDWKRERSLLALGQAVRGEDDAEASLVSIGDRANSSWREDAATRHRLARSRREAHANPTPSAAAGAERFQPGEQPAAAAQGHAWRSQEEAGTGDLPTAASRARTAPEEPSGSGRPDDAPGSRHADEADASGARQPAMEAADRSDAGGSRRCQVEAADHHDDDIGRRARRRHRAVDTKEIRSHHRTDHRAGRPEAFRSRSHPIGGSARCRVGCRRNPDQDAYVRQCSQQGRRQAQSRQRSRVQRPGFRRPRRHVTDPLDTVAP